MAIFNIFLSIYVSQCSHRSPHQLIGISLYCILSCMCLNPGNLLFESSFVWNKRDLSTADIWTGALSVIMTY